MARAVGTKSRFLIAYLVLAAAVGAALGAFIVLLQRPAPKPAPAWSSWKPDSTSVDTQMREIADHVGGGYRLLDGNQIVSVQLDNRNLRSIVVPKVQQPKNPSDFSTYDRSATAIYLLCGFGPHCRVSPGNQATASGTLLRREALELALYSLKYVHPIDNVLVFFPPASNQKAVSATLFFHRGDLNHSLDHPLKKTLPQPVPLAPGQIRPAEKRTVDDLTKATYYHYLRTEDVQGYGNVVELLPPS